MQKRPFTPMAWTKVGLGVLPGVLIVGTRGGLFRHALGLENWLALMRWVNPSQIDGVATCIALGIVAAGLAIERRLAAWSFPALGMLFFWGPPRLFSAFARLGDPHRSSWQTVSLLMSAGYLAIAAIGTFAAYRAYRHHRFRVPRLGWALLGLMIVVGVTDSVVQAMMIDLSPDKWASLVSSLRLQLWWTGVVLLPAAMGLLLAQRGGLLAGLFVVGSQFVLVEEILDPTYSVSFQAYWHPSAALHRAEVALSCLPALCFLVLTPIWVYRSRSTHGRALGLVLPPLVALIGADLIAGSALHGAAAAYSIGGWVTRGLDAVQWSIGLALAAVVYHRIGPGRPTERNGARGERAESGDHERSGVMPLVRVQRRQPG